MDEPERPSDASDLELTRMLRDLDLDFGDDGPPSDLRARTLVAVRDTAAGGRTAPQRERVRTRRPSRGWSLAGGFAVAASALAALVLVLSNAGADRTVTLAGVDGRVIVEVRGTEATLRGGSPALRPGERYELWTITGNSAKPTLRSAGTYRPSADGQIRATLTLPKGTPSDAALAVTRERDRDPAPSLPPVLSET